MSVSLEFCNFTEVKKVFQANMKFSGANPPTNDRLEDTRLIPLVSMPLGKTEKVK